MTAILFSLGTLANDIENGVSAWSKYRSSQTLFVRLRMFLNSKCHMFFSMKNLLSPSLHIIYVYFPDHLQFFFCIFHINFHCIFSIFKMLKNVFTWNEVFTCIELGCLIWYIKIVWSFYSICSPCSDLIQEPCGISLGQGCGDLIP